MRRRLLGALTVAFRFAFVAGAGNGVADLLKRTCTRAVLLDALTRILPAVAAVDNARLPSVDCMGCGILGRTGGTRQFSIDTPIELPQLYRQLPNQFLLNFVLRLIVRAPGIADYGEIAVVEVAESAWRTDHAPNGYNSDCMSDATP